jgi:hypothetical protein
MRSYLGVAKKEGITEEEIGAAQAIVMAVAAGRTSAQLEEVRVREKHQASAAESSKSCGQT